MNTGLAKERLLRLAEMEGRHFWFVGRRVLVDGLLGKYLNRGSRVLNLGCGTGKMVEALMGRGYRVVGLEPPRDGLQTDLSPESLIPLFHNCEKVELRDVGHRRCCSRSPDDLSGALGHTRRGHRVVGLD
jgi:SAM-dependent methyltransferase